MSSNVTPQELPEEEFQDELKPGTELLHGQYTIEQFLNNGGFGITYLAKDSLLRTVVIKECFPESICRRANSTVRVRSRNQAEAFRTIVDLFIEEARSLAKLSHPHIVGVHQVFEDNDTAYMAMDFVEGSDLLEVAEGRSTVEPAELELITYKLLDAIGFIHREGVLHRDISPDNILLGKDNEPVLIDFGAARETVTRSTSYLGSMRTVKDGYSPQEFYAKEANQDPSSDLYSFAASLYHVMSNELPVSAQLRMTAIATGDPDPYVSIKELVSGYSESFLDAIDLALRVFPKDRIQSAADWSAMIENAVSESIRRGVVSRPVLAVDNGSILEQFEGKKGSPLGKQRERPVKPAAPRSERPAAYERDAVTSQAQLAQAMAPKNATSGNGLFIGVGVLALAAVIGVAAVFMSGGDDAEIASSAPAVTAPEASVPQTAGATPEAPAPRQANRPEQVPFFLAESSQDVVVSSAGRTGLSPSATGPVVSAPAPARGPETAPATVPAETEAPVASDNGDIAVIQEALPGVQELAAVMTGPALQFEVVADPTDPARIASVAPGTPDIFQPGRRIVSVNGFPIDSLADFQRVVAATSDYEVGDEVRVSFGVLDPSTGNTSVESATLPAVQQTVLLNGMAFETRQDRGSWVTYVTSEPESGTSELKVGDRLIALMPDNELINTRTALPDILRRELDAGTSVFNFAVIRGEEMWLVAMPYADVTN
jgi:serine/threonine protein kinase